VTAPCQALAYEAMLGKRLIVILNDSKVSIAPPTGAMAHL
jgi:deoxyxylulose-5-phosphate synthase